MQATPRPTTAAPSGRSPRRQSAVLANVEPITASGMSSQSAVGAVAGAEMSAVLRTCQSCGDRRAIGELRSYRSVGLVPRCPACEDVGAVLGVQEKRIVVEWRGLHEIAR